MVRSAGTPSEGANLSEPARPGTKQALLFEMLQRPDGASIPELASATGWKPNTVHAALSTMRKMGHEIAAEGHASGRASGRRYRLG